MRCTQPQGLPKEANDFLAAHALKIDECPQCHRHSGYKVTQIGVDGMFDDLPIWRYHLKGGLTADEAIQKVVWSSGPMIWLKLVVSDGRVFAHPEEAIMIT